MNRIDDLIMRLCPNGVEFKAVGDVADYVRGVTYSKHQEQADGPIHVLRSNNITLSSNTLNFDDVKNVSANVRVRKDQHLYANDILISAASGSKAHVGKVAYIWDDIDYVFGGFMAVLRTNGGIEPRFLFHLLIGRTFSEYLERTLSTTTINNLNSKVMGAFRIPIPPVEVQREIVRILDLFARLEGELESILEAEAQARQAQHAHYRRSILGQAESSQSKENEVALSEVVEFTNGKAHERLVVPDGSIAVLTARFISTGGKSVRWVNPKDALTPARVGDIAMVMSDLPNGRALARCFYVEEDGKYTANQRVCLLRVRDESSLSPRWLYHFLDRNPQLLAYDNGQDQTHLKKGQILGIQVPLIPLAEQEWIVAILDRLDVSMRELVTGLQVEREARRKQYEHYRDRLVSFKELAA